MTDIEEVLVEELPAGYTLDEAGFSKLVLNPTNQFIEHRRLYKLEDRFFFKSDKYGIIEVPRGVMTDMASVPRCLLPIIPKDGRYLHAAVIHDYMYHVAMYGFKFVADEVFDEGMRKLGVKRWRRFLIRLGVKHFGKGAYTK